MRKIGLTLLFLIFSLGGVLACECIVEITETLKQKVDIASVIFYGEVVSFADTESPRRRIHYSNDYEFEKPDKAKSGYHPQFRVIDILKGDLDEELKGGRFFLQQFELAVCSDVFELEEKYLVLANRDENGVLWLRLCNPPLVFEDQKAYLKVKREILKIKDVSGF